MSYEIITFQDLFYLDSAVSLAELSEEQVKRSEEQKSNHHRAAIVGAITCAASFLECSINGLFDYARNPSRRTKLHRALSTVWSESFDRQPTLAKYQIALALARKEGFKPDSEPYQSAAVLLELRNAIAHPKEIAESEEQQQKLERKLTGKFRFKPIEEHRREFFPSRCLSPDGAYWAVEVSVRFFIEFLSRMPCTSYLFDTRNHFEAVFEKVRARRKKLESA